MNSAEEMSPTEDALMLPGSCMPGANAWDDELTVAITRKRSREEDEWIRRLAWQDEQTKKMERWEEEERMEKKKREDAHAKFVAEQKNEWNELQRIAAVEKAERKRIEAEESRKRDEEEEARTKRIAANRLVWLREIEAMNKKPEEDRKRPEEAKAEEEMRKDEEDRKRAEDAEVDEERRKDEEDRKRVEDAEMELTPTENDQSATEPDQDVATHAHSQPSGNKVDEAVENMKISLRGEVRRSVNVVQLAMMIQTRSGQPFG